MSASHLVGNQGLRYPTKIDFTKGSTTNFPSQSKLVSNPRFHVPTKPGKTNYAISREPKSLNSCNGEELNQTQKIDID